MYLPTSKSFALTCSAVKHFSDEDSIGRQDLQCVLYALLHHLPNLVYEQGLCYIAGMLLLHVEAER